MDRPLKLWEFVAGIICMAITFGTIIYNCGTMNAKNELRITTLENNFTEFRKDSKDQFIELKKNQDEIKNNLFDVKLMLQEKSDRKK